MQGLREGEVDACHTLKSEVKKFGAGFKKISTIGKS